jgi:hypothetical protein
VPRKGVARMMVSRELLYVIEEGSRDYTNRSRLFVLQECGVVFETMASLGQLGGEFEPRLYGDEGGIVVGNDEKTAREDNA